MPAIKFRLWDFIISKTSQPLKINPTNLTTVTWIGIKKKASVVLYFDTWLSFYPFQLKWKFVTQRSCCKSLCCSFFCLIHITLSYFWPRSLLLCLFYVLLSCCVTYSSFAIFECWNVDFWLIESYFVVFLAQLKSHWNFDIGWLTGSADVAVWTSQCTIIWCRKFSFSYFICSYCLD